MVSLHMKSYALVATVLTVAMHATNAFVPTTPMESFSTAATLTSLHMKQTEQDTSFSRRNFLAAALAASATLAQQQPAQATYSAYTRREQDWQTRDENGAITFSNARELRRQLLEVAPANAAGRDKIFCPNGPSAAVSPLMENKCGDREALPSVYGRSVDVVGNSIPGFTNTNGLGGGNGANLASEVGGFPKYKK